MNDVKKIIKNLEEDVENKNIAKQKFSNWAEELGFQIESEGSEIELWNSLDKFNLPGSITASGIDLSQNQLRQSNLLVNELEKSQVKSFMTATGSTSVALSAVAMSGASLSYPSDQLPTSFTNLTRINDFQLNRKNISEKLKAINLALAIEYDNAWSSYFSGSSDKTRSPMFLMREVFNHLLKSLSPDEKVRNQEHLIETDKITRAQRLNFIALKLDDITRQAIMAQEKALIRIYEELSKAHKPGVLDTEETKGYLYQANTLIKLLLDSNP